MFETIVVIGSLGFALYCYWTAEESKFYFKKQIKKDCEEEIRNIEGNYEFKINVLKDEILVLKERNQHLRSLIEKPKEDISENVIEKALASFI